jgi:hypothetical protein
MNNKGLASLVEGLPPTYWLIWTGTLINRLGGFVIPFLTLYLTTQRAIPVSQAALMVSLFGAGSFLAQLSGGELSDRLGRRPVMLMSFFITPIFMVVLGLARDLLLVSVATLIVGFFTDLYRPAVGAAIADLVPPESRTRAYGYNYWAINLGAAVAPVIAGLMAQYDYIILFIADAATTAVFGFIVLFGIRETRPAEAQHAAHTPLTERISELKRAPILLITIGHAVTWTGSGSVWNGHCREWFPDHLSDDPGQQHGEEVAPLRNDGHLCRAAWSRLWIHRARLEFSIVCPERCDLDPGRDCRDIRGANNHCRPVADRTARFVSGNFRRGLGVSIFCWSSRRRMGLRKPRSRYALDRVSGDRHHDCILLSGAQRSRQTTDDTIRYAAQ